ncbi:indolepyruvate ferredoxin oxidoreductase family protein [Phenylobacterium sp. LjRoot225]|uniref:indolepyruvate ferredoxin oxidoreductase family protein n=1 Tax=Phenylobacterium sp. LjRoot225 TaxID=3342285 RepID=UPI003ECC86E5
MTKTVVTLDDKYAQESGQVFLSSLQALVRLPIDQARRDRAAGLTTAGYVTGYRGSPITTLDAQLWAAAKLLGEHDVRFEPGLNEELAATSLRGTQQLEWFGASRYSGVYAMWYAKGVGVDRACEALKLANLEGASANGGALVVAGDDHAAKSSASAHQSEHTLIAGFIPVLYPATTDEILEFGLYGWELSRYSGLYVGMKTITDTLDLTSTATLPAPGFQILRPELPAGRSLNLRNGMTALESEAVTVNQRLPAAQAFVRANGIDRIPLDAERREITIVTAGKAYLDVRQALQDLGFDEPRRRAAGIRVVKIGMVWPLEAEFVKAACAGSREVLVVEEKRPVVEDQLAHIFYRLSADQRPEIVGKRDPEGRELLPANGVLDPGKVRRALVRRLEAHGMLDEETRNRADAFLRAEGEVSELKLIASRPAFFCSGCPHNTSTVIPEGSMAMGATGCHGLAAYMPERRTMITVGMGSEGMPWVAAGPYVDTPHMFQNMGDGTFTHSGLLSIRAAVAAKTNVTFKILFNDAVAMTGGQPAEGGLTADMMVRELVVEGVKPVVLLSEEPQRFDGLDIPAGVRVLHRDHLDEVQRELRETPGVTAVVYDQTCANEKRRRRKRGMAADPDMRLYINPAVCEGCGDCSKQSNCMSIQPLETEFGRKRLIDQSSCNKDYSCVKGFCPSFVSVRGGQIAKRSIDAGVLAEKMAGLPTPAVVEPGVGGYSLMVTGIGGTGVLTVGAVLGMAAHLEGKSAKVLDMTGMAQKGGAVTSHIKIGADVDQIPSARLGTAQADLLIACDLIVASSPDVLAVTRTDTRVVANDEIAPTGDFQANNALDLSKPRFLAAIRKTVDDRNIATVPAHTLSTKLVGDSIFTNIMMVGFAAQKGCLPVSVASIEEAVRLNGVAVKANLQAFALGRLAAQSADDLLALADAPQNEPAFPTTLPEMLESRSHRLTAYQDARYAGQYQAFVRDLEARLRGRGVAAPETFLMEVANQLARLMAYKDEYEVARLYSTPEFHASLRDQFAGDVKLSLNLAPPLIALRKDAKTGRPKKIEFGPWIFPVLKVMSRFKTLRGGALDPFGYTAERRLERRLIGEYRQLISSVADKATDANMAVAVQLAGAAGSIAGYGPVKDAGVETYREAVAALLPQLDAPSEPLAVSKRRTVPA